jgi:hypothetical protein
MVIKDLHINYGKVKWSTVEGKVNDNLHISGYVVIYRDYDYYAVRIQQNYEFDEDSNNVETTYKALSDFMERCQNISDNWKLVEPMEGIRGPIIGQTKLDYIR